MILFPTIGKGQQPMTPNQQELPMTMPQYRAPFTLENMKPFLTGKLSWPIVVEKSLEEIVCMLVVCRMVPVLQGKMRARIGSKNSSFDAHYYLNHTQAGALDGRAWVLWGTYVPEANDVVAFARAAAVSLCDHVRTVGSSAQPLRGWSPAKCLKCGLDMTVDSGD